jgi:sigma-B regulation protein RsbU (phosphoserine phosphatase)
LGVDEGAVYVVRDYDLQPGDMLFLYTDGLTEAKNEAREMFGAPRVIECLSSEADCKAQIEQMTQAVHQFVGSAPQSDDLTMLAIRYKNNNK